MANNNTREIREAIRDGEVDLNMSNRSARGSARLPVTDIYGDAFGVAGDGTKVDLYFGQDQTYSYGNHNGIGIEEAGKKYAVWVSQREDDNAPKVQLYNYTDRLPDGSPTVTPIYNSELGTRINNHVFNAVLQAQVDKNRDGTPNVGSQDFDRLAADARDALRAAGITSTNGGRSR